MRIIDADGHVNDRRCMDEVARYMPKGNQFPPVFPELDHLHTFFLKKQTRLSRTGNPGPHEWIDFMDNTGIETTVLYPTAGLAVGRIASPGWAFAACRAYNNWLHEKFLTTSTRFNGMALVPIQDTEHGVEELRRAVIDLGMCGAMLPSNGEGLKGHLGSNIYWPIYEEAERLNCPLAIHGGCHHQLGMDSFGTFYPVRGLGHPFGIMIQAAAMLFHGVFDRFPNLRVAFLEGGAGWVPFFLDRMDRSYEGEKDPGHLQVDISGNSLKGDGVGRMPSEYFGELVRKGRIFIGFDCDEVALGYAVQRVGREAFVFASDFPHESTSAQSSRKEIEELLGRDELTAEDKLAVLGENATRLYRLRRDDTNKLTKI